MSWTRLWTTARWLGLTASVVAVSASASTSTGLRGAVTIGPLTPICSITMPCDGPAKHVTLTFSGARLLRHAVTTSTGTYRVLLPSGFYTVHANRGMSIRPSRVWVRRGALTRVDFAIDTGIR